MAKSKAKSGMSKPLKKKAVAKKKKPVKKPARKKKTIRSSAVKYVWRMYRYLQRFEMPDDARGFRQSPPFYVKRFIGRGHDLESIGHQDQIDLIIASPNRKGLMYLYDRVIDIAAFTTRCYRGYVLNAKLQPATDPEIAARARLPIAETRSLLKELARIGLIERVPVPVFDPDGIEPPKDKKAREKTKKKTKKKAKKKAKKKRRVRSTPERSGAARSALRGKDKDKSEVKIEKETKLKKEVSKKESKKKAAALPKENPKMKKPKASSGKGKEKLKGPRLARKAKDPIPINPTGSDAGGANQDIATASPPSSYSPSAVARRLDKLYDPAAKSFAMLIYEKMKVPYRPDSSKGKQELGNYATAWMNAQQAGLTPSALAMLWDSAEADAVSMAKKRRRLKFKKSPEAVWRSLFNKRLNAAITRILSDKPGNAAVS